MTLINRCAVVLTFAAWSFAMIAVTAGAMAAGFKDREVAATAVLFTVIAGIALAFALCRARRWPA